MKKTISALFVFSLYLVCAAPVKAAEFLGYPLAPVQARFYLTLLWLIAFSMALVGGAYAVFWLIDLKKKGIKLPQPALSRASEAFAGELITVVQPVE